MQTRELYRQKYEAELKELGARIEVMKAQAATLSAQAQLDMKPHVDAVQAQLGLPAMLIPRQPGAPG